MGMKWKFKTKRMEFEVNMPPTVFNKGNLIAFSSDRSGALNGELLETSYNELQIYQD